jgi:multidrug efflux pump subunit AcrA (membrane-fusion protein)
MKKILIILFLFIFTACSNESEIKTKKTQEFFVLKGENFSESLSLSGTLEPIKQTIVSPKVNGKLVEIYADTGDFVFKNTLLAKLEGSESKVNLKTSSLNEKNIQDFYNSQSSFYDTQINNAKQQYNLIKAQLDSAVLNKKNVNLTNTENTEFSKRQVKEAETALKNAKKTAEKKLDTVYNSSKTSIVNALMVIYDSSDYLDTVFGVSEEKESLNDSYEDYIGVKNNEILKNTENLIADFLIKKQELKNIYEEKIENKTPSFKEYDEYLNIFLESLEKLKIILNFAYKALDASATSVSFSEKTLNEFKTNILNLGAKVENSILSTEGGQKRGVKGVILNIDEIKTTNEVNIENAQKNLEKIKQSESKVNAQTIQTLDQSDSQIKILQEQLKQANLAIKNAKEQKNTVLKELKTQIDLVKGNKQLSQVAVNNNDIGAPFTGVITQKISELGQVVSPSVPVFNLADISSYLVKVEIPDIFIQDLELGLKAELSLSGFSQGFIGKISKIYPKLKPMTNKLPVEITVKNLPVNVKIGQFVKVKLKLKEKKSYFVPERFIFYDQKGAFVKTKDGEKRISLGVKKDGDFKIWFAGQMEGIQLLK